MAHGGLDDQAISVLVDIARTAGADLNPSQRLKLDELLATALVERIVPPAHSEPERYAVTPAGQRLLDERGIGANES